MRPIQERLYEGARKLPLAHPRSSERPMIYGILLVYYEVKHERAIEAFKDLFASLHQQHRVFIVNNNTELDCSGALPGDNTNQEFSGWDVVLRTLVLQKTDVIVLANDTFLDGGKWSLHRRRRFQSKLSEFCRLEEDYALCGEVVAFPGGYELFGCRANAWVRTHIFALRGALLEDLGRLSLSDCHLCSAIRDFEDNKFVWGEAVGESLRRRIDSWLTPSEGEIGWRKLQTADRSRKLSKAKSILNEKWISAFCLANGYRIMDAGPSSVVKGTASVIARLRRLVFSR